MRFAFGGTANSSRPLLDSSSISFASPGLPSEPSDQDAWNVNPVEADTQNRSGVQSAGQSGEQNGQQNVQEGEEAKPFFSSKLHGWSVGAAGGTWPTYAEDNQLEVLEALQPHHSPRGPRGRRRSDLRTSEACRKHRASRAPKVRIEPKTKLKVKATHALQILMRYQRPGGLRRNQVLSAIRFSEKKR